MKNINLRIKNSVNQMIKELENLFEQVIQNMAPRDRREKVKRE